MRFGHHFYNWDRAWDDDLDLRLRLTKETGWEGWEAKPGEIGEPAHIVKEKCEALGIVCAAVGGGIGEAMDYAYTVGASIVRSSVSVDECDRWVNYAGERGIEIVVHPHVGRGGPGTGNVETREDMLRYLDERPGIYACPDTGNLMQCGSDPVQTIRDLGERCRYIHLKDIDLEMAAAGMRGQSFCDLGTGDLDLPGVMQALEEMGFDGWVMVERDRRVEDYAQSARNMRQALRNLGYG